jgi:hypothetical protein
LNSEIRKNGQKNLDPNRKQRLIIAFDKSKQVNSYLRNEPGMTMLADEMSVVALIDRRTFGNGQANRALQ